MFGLENEPVQYRAQDVALAMQERGDMRARMSADVRVRVRAAHARRCQQALSEKVPNGVSSGTISLDWSSRTVSPSQCYSIDPACFFWASDCSRLDTHCACA